MKKGFTLIELLAVIIILAALAIITTPIILGVVNDSKKKPLKTLPMALSMRLNIIIQSQH